MNPIKQIMAVIVTSSLLALSTGCAKPNETKVEETSTVAEQIESVIKPRLIPNEHSSALDEEDLNVVEVKPDSFYMENPYSLPWDAIADEIFSFYNDGLGNQIWRLDNPFLTPNALLYYYVNKSGEDACWTETHEVDKVHCYRFIDEMARKVEVY